MRPRAKRLAPPSRWYISSMTLFDPIFVALKATGVRYVVVGGLAVNLHGLGYKPVAPVETL